MRRKPYLSLLLAVILLGGMLALFPTVWMALLIVLLALVALQVVLVRRSLYRVPAGQAQVAVPLPRKVAPVVPAPEGAEPTASPGPASGGPAPSAPASGPVTPAAAAAEPTSEAPANIDTELFSRFRQHLERAETETADATPPPPNPEPLGGSEVQDRVDISRSARRAAPPATLTRRPAPPPSAPAKAGREPAPDQEPDGPDLFADLRPAPLPQPAPPPKPAEGPGAKTPEAPRALSPEPAAPARRAERSPVPAVPPREDAPGNSDAVASTAAPAPAAGGADEVSAALAGEGGDAPGLADEAATLLHLAEEAAVREDWEGLRAGLDNYLAHLAEAPRLIQWRARRLQVRLAIHDKDPHRALQGFEELLATGHRPPAEEVPALLDGLLAGAEPQMAASLRVSMLVRILALFRQRRDQRAMDLCYGWIEDAQEQVGDERRLLQYLKNHLEIRKVLGDLPGQLELIDQLGNRCYRLGLTDDAKTYYEAGLRLRAQAEQSGDATVGQPDEAPAGEPASPGGAVREG